MKPNVELTKFNPDNPTHVAELRRQRILCGWAAENVDGWLDEVRQGDKGLYWIFPQNPADFKIPEVEEFSLEAKTGPPPPDSSFQPIGHISLDWVDYRKDASLANREEKKVILGTFFVLKSQQGGGVGGAAMDAIEALAASPAFSARTITLNTIAAECSTSREWHEKVGFPWVPNAPITEHWYERRGYVKYKTAPRYPWTNSRTGEKLLLDGAFLKKDLTVVEQS